MPDVFLYPGESSPSDVRLRDPTVPAGGGGFPTQFPGLRVYYGGAVRELCLVAAADAPAGVGAALLLRRGAATLAVYLVSPSDPQASPVRLQTTTGVRAVRIRT